MKIDREISSMVILPLPLIQEEQLSLLVKVCAQALVKHKEDYLEASQEKCLFNKVCQEFCLSVHWFICLSITFVDTRVKVFVSTFIRPYIIKTL